MIAHLVASERPLAALTPPECTDADARQVSCPRNRLGAGRGRLPPRGAGTRPRSRAKVEVLRCLCWVTGRLPLAVPVDWARKGRISGRTC